MKTHITIVRKIKEYFRQKDYEDKWDLVLKFAMVFCWFPLLALCAGVFLYLVYCLIIGIPVVGNGDEFIFSPFMF